MESTSEERRRRVYYHYIITHMVALALALGLSQEPVARGRNVPADDDELLVHKTRVWMSEQRSYLGLPIALQLSVGILGGTAVSGGFLKAQEFSCVVGSG